MSETNGKEKIIEMKNLKKYFPMKKKQVLKAVDNVTMDIYRGEVLSLVGVRKDNTWTYCKQTLSENGRRYFSWWKTCRKLQYKGIYQKNTDDISGSPGFTKSKNDSGRYCCRRDRYS